MLKCNNCAYVISSSFSCCPNCKTKIQKIRTAQFGGVGQQPNPFAPGSSPYGRSPRGTPTLPNLGLRGLADEGLDVYMETTRINPSYDKINENYNIEKRLQPFHNRFEDDKINDLDFHQRKKIKDEYNKKLTDSQRDMQDMKKSINNNSADYIKKHFKPSPEHITTIEEKLESFRINEPEEKMIINCSSNFNRRRVAVRVNPKTTTVFGPHDNTDDAYSNNINLRNKTWEGFDGYIHHTPTFFTQNEFEQNLGKEGAQFLKFIQTEKALSKDFLEADQVSYSGKSANDITPSPIRKELVNTNLTIEDKLRRMKYPNKYPRPQDPYRTQERQEILGLFSDKSVFEKYPDPFFGLPQLPTLEGLR